MVFSGIREIVAAYQAPRGSVDPAVNDAFGFLVSIQSQAAVGFLGRERRSDPVAVAVTLLQEHGRKLTHDQTVQVVQMLQRLEKSRGVRRRFAVQLLITIAAIGVALAVILGLISASDDVKNIAYGLIGTVVGYWLK